MCGLVGAFKADKASFTKINTFITQGLFLSTLRGYSGTGVGLVDKKYRPDFVKSRLDAPSFLQTREYSWVEKEALDARVVMGHTRAPTGGSTNKENAHPFMYYNTEDREDEILLTHNGHVNNYHSLTPAEFRHDVDSAHVTWSILIKGAEETLKKLTGYYVLVWFDRKRKELNIARNAINRDLYLAMSPGKDIIYYASEREILQFLLDRNDIPYFGKGTPEAFQQLDQMKRYRWDLTKENLESPVIETYEEEKKSYSYNPLYHGYSGPILAPGDKVYAYVPKDDLDKAFLFYTNSKSNPPTVSEEFGRVTAERRVDGAVITIDGVKKSEWDEKWKHINNWIPCVLDSVGNITSGTVTKTHYKVHINLKLANEEYNRSNTALSNPKLLGAFLPQTTTNPPSNNELETKLPLEDSQRRVIGPKNTMISLLEWREMAKLGCLVCNGSILSPVDIGRVEFFAWGRCPEDPEQDTEYQMICPVCKNDTEKLRMALGA